MQNIECRKTPYEYGGTSLSFDINKYKN
ncbi:hypothetical protein YPPY103_3548, partial [Yersinia pestis PY-103]